MIVMGMCNLQTLEYMEYSVLVFGNSSVGVFECWRKEVSDLSP